MPTIKTVIRRVVALGGAGLATELIPVPVGTQRIKASLLNETAGANILVHRLVPHIEISDGVIDVSRNAAPFVVQVVANRVDTTDNPSDEISCSTHIQWEYRPDVSDTEFAAVIQFFDSATY